MKLLLLSVLCLFNDLVIAQSSGKNDEILQKYELLKKLKQGEVYKDSVPNKFYQYLRPYEFDVSLMPNKNKVIQLPQSNMPCVIPDTGGIAQMPNAWGKVSVPFRSLHQPIPNPATPFRFYKNPSLAPPDQTK